MEGKTVEQGVSPDRAEYNAEPSEISLESVEPISRPIEAPTVGEPPKVEHAPIKEASREVPTETKLQTGANNISEIVALENHIAGVTESSMEASEER